MSVQTQHREGGPCANRLIDRRGYNLGCIGRLKVVMHTEARPGVKRPDPNGTIALLVCPRCGQGYGRTA